MTDCEHGVVVVSGLGHNGMETVKKLITTQGVRKIIGVLRSEEKLESANAMIRDFKETLSTYKYPEAEFTADAEKTLGNIAPHIWINWKGINLATYKKQNPDLEKKAKEQGRNLRDMVLEPNLEIAIKDVEQAKNAGAKIYMQQGNPTEPISRSTLIHAGYEHGKVVSTGTDMEFQRRKKLFSINFPEISLDRATGLYIGSHGEGAVPAEFYLGIGPVDEVVFNLYGKEGLNKLASLDKEVNEEAVWLRERTGETPSQGPAAVTADIVSMIVNPSEKKTLVGITTYLDGEYGLKDISMSVPCLVGPDGAKVVSIEYDTKTMDEFYRSAKHIKEMNKIADEHYKKIV